MASWTRTRCGAGGVRTPTSGGGKDPRSVVDLGGASGRVSRQFALEWPAAECWNFDINPQHVEWIAAHLRGTGIKAVNIEPSPALPLASGSIDLLVAFSVFTHIEHQDTAWIAEIARVLSPGGLAVITIHSERTWANLDPTWGIWQGLIENGSWSPHGKATPELFQQPMPSDRVVFHWSAAGSYNCNVFYRLERVLNAWGPILPIVETRVQAFGYQDAVIMRKS